MKDSTRSMKVYRNWVFVLFVWKIAKCFLGFFFVDAEVVVWKCFYILELSKLVIRCVFHVDWTRMQPVEFI